LENAFYDKDLRAAEAVVRLYHRYGIEVSRIQSSKHGNARNVMLFH
jgi:hypothetical protein